MIQSDPIPEANFYVERKRCSHSDFSQYQFFSWKLLKDNFSNFQLWILQTRWTKEGLRTLGSRLRRIGCCQQDRNYINGEFHYSLILMSEKTLFTLQIQIKDGCFLSLIRVYFLLTAYLAQDLSIDTICFWNDDIRFWIHNQFRENLCIN